MSYGPTPPPPPKPPKPRKPRAPKPPKSPWDEQDTNKAAGQPVNKRPTHYADGLDTGP